MSLAKELWGFTKVRKKYWLAPIVIVLVVLSGFIALAASAPVVVLHTTHCFRLIGGLGDCTSPPCLCPGK